MVELLLNDLIRFIVEQVVSWRDVPCPIPSSHPSLGRLPLKSEISTNWQPDWLLHLCQALGFLGDGFLTLKEKDLSETGASRNFATLAIQRLRLLKAVEFHLGSVGQPLRISIRTTIWKAAARLGPDPSSNMENFHPRIRIQHISIIYNNL